ncbi:MAG: DUF2935 domain-containing protein [Clostridia bacterium]|nr:DUF2935 domain-containing protein [Clostridia bacterium]
MFMHKITPAEFVRESLELNLFFLRIMKEHSFFLEAGFLPKDNKLAKRAGRFRVNFEKLLEEAVDLADGRVSRAVLKSGEVVTDNTVRAEKRTQLLSGVPFDTGLTRKEAELKPGAGDPKLEDRVANFNNRVIEETEDLVEFKTRVLEGMLDCRLFTWNFPLLIEHIRREAKFFIDHLQRLQKRASLDPADELLEEKIFWDRIMAEHSLFIAHLLDPSETDLINTAEDFAREFFKLESRAKRVKKDTVLPRQLLRDEIRATRGIREFKNTAKDLILACEVRSVIIPLLADHVLREANHFYRILTQGEERNLN